MASICINKLTVIGSDNGWAPIWGPSHYLNQWLNIVNSTPRNNSVNNKSKFIYFHFRKYIWKCQRNWVPFVSKYQNGRGYEFCYILICFQSVDIFCSVGKPNPLNCHFYDKLYIFFLISANGIHVEVCLAACLVTLKPRTKLILLVAQMIYIDTELNNSCHVISLKKLMHNACFDEWFLFAICLLKW